MPDLVTVVLSQVAAVTDVGQGRRGRTVVPDATR